MLTPRQYELIRGLCLAGLRAQETNFALARELIEIGEIAEAKIAAATSSEREALVLAEAERISSAALDPAQPR
jgi:hypothetical protein